MWTDNMARQVRALKPYVPMGLKYILSEEDGFMKLTIDTESMLNLVHDDKTAAVVWMNTVKMIVEGEGGILLVTRAPYKDYVME